MEDQSEDTIEHEEIFATVPISHMDIAQRWFSFLFPRILHGYLVCGGRPAETDSSIIYCAEAAFSAKCQNEFDHHNVIGNHVPDGKYYYGSPSKTNTGAFVFYNGKWKFLYDSYAGELTKAANNGGMGFGQNMIIY